MCLFRTVGRVFQISLRWLVAATIWIGSRVFGGWIARTIFACRYGIVEGVE
jgi:hypothetical protein